MKRFPLPIAVLLLQSVVYSGELVKVVQPPVGLVKITTTDLLNDADRIEWKISAPEATYTIDSTGTSVTFGNAEKGTYTFQVMAIVSGTEDAALDIIEETVTITVGGIPTAPTTPTTPTVPPTIPTTPPPERPSLGLINKVRSILSLWEPVDNGKVKSIAESYRQAALDIAQNKPGWTDVDEINRRKREQNRSILGDDLNDIGWRLFWKSLANQLDALASDGKLITPADYGLAFIEIWEGLTK